MKCTNEYKKFTIKSLLNSLEEIMARNPQITLDSEVVISDTDMSFFKQDIKVYPTFDFRSRQMRVGLYLSPCENVEKANTTEAKEKTITTTVKKSTEVITQKEIKATKDFSWFKKYV